MEGRRAQVAVLAQPFHEQASRSAGRTRSLEPQSLHPAQEVLALLEKLGLTPCKDVKIGTNLSKGISGGQAKRVNIGACLSRAAARPLGHALPVSFPPSPQCSAAQCAFAAGCFDMTKA